ncbi:unnamed protein product [Rhodiola kirilowii]
MPSNIELIHSLGNAVETIEGRLGPMENTMTQVLAALERLTKSVEDMDIKVQNLQTPPPPRHDKQHIHPNLPPLLATPTSQPTIDDPPATPDARAHGSHNHGLPEYPQSSNNPTKPMRTPRLEVPIFNGDGVEGWLFQLERFFDLHETPPEQMLAVAPLYMTGEALRWYQWKHITGQIHTWVQLARDIKRRFGPTDYWDAEVALNKLLQTASVSAYITSFETMSTRTPGLTANNLLCRFLAGLKEDYTEN